MASDGEFVKAKKALEEKNAANESLYNTIVEKQAIIDQLEKEVRVLKEQRDKADAEAKNTKAELNSYATDVRKLQKELDGERGDVEAVRSALEAEKKRTADLQKREDRLETDLENCRKQFSALQDECDHHVSMNSSLHDALDRLEDEKGKAEQKALESESVRDAYDAINSIFEQKFALLGMDLTPDTLVDYLRSFGQLDDKRTSWNGSFDIQIQPGGRPGMKDRQVSVASLGDELLNEDLDSGDDASEDQDFPSQKLDFAVQRRLGHRKKASLARSEAASEIVQDPAPDHEANNAAQDDVTDHGLAGMSSRPFLASQMRYKSTQTPSAPVEDAKEVPKEKSAQPASAVNASISIAKEDLIAKDETIRRQTDRIWELEATIATNEGTIEELKLQITSRTSDISEKDATIKQHADRVKSLEDIVAQHTLTKHETLPTQPHPIKNEDASHENNNHIQTLEQTIATQSKTIAELRTLAFKRVAAAATETSSRPTTPDRPRLRKSPSTTAPVKHIVHVREGTFAETLARAPGSMKLLLTAMFIAWAALCISAYHERSIWVSANDTAYVRLRNMQYHHYNTWLPSGLVAWMESLINFDRTLPG